MRLSSVPSLARIIRKCRAQNPLSTLPYEFGNGFKVVPNDGECLLAHA